MLNFYPRSPCGERLLGALWVLSILIFLSTLSLRRATIVGGAGNNAIRISIHALLAESDEPTATGNDKDNIFLSTLSLRRATASQGVENLGVEYFYPRSPCGERLCISERITSDLKFLSTLSLRRATATLLRKYHTTDISIHALLAESDAASITPTASRRNFYPRSPCGERLYQERQAEFSEQFLSTLSLRRATDTTYNLSDIDDISIHALLAESDCLRCCAISCITISIHALLAESDA